VVIVKKKRTISIKNSKLRIIRDALRQLISEAAIVKRGELLRKKSDLSLEHDREEIEYLADKIDKLYTTWKKSITICPLCGSRTSNMTFNPVHKSWLCTECYAKNQEFYRMRGEVHLYP